jgi:glycosyltransferase involved in cell wall biosynthesis
VSQKEADLFVRVFPGAANIAVIPNGVDHQYFRPDPESSRGPGPDPGPDDTADVGPDHTPDHNLHEDRPAVAFFGAMDYYANVDGAIWFARQILPAVRQKIPDVLFFIVGSSPAPELTALAAADAGIRVTGFVEDIRPWYTRARVCVIPLRIARGVQNKVLEAMSMEKAIVTTSPAVQGITLPQDPPLAVTDDPDRFAAHVTALLQDAPRRRKMGRAARQHIKEHFNWDRNMKALVSETGQALNGV